MALSSICLGLLITILLMQSLQYQVVIAHDLHIGSIVTLEFFEQIISDVSVICPGALFYAYVPFIAAATAFPAFLATGSLDVAKRETAAFFANVAHETEGWCYIAEQDPTSDYCDPSYTQYPCVPGRKYYGRGPLQLSWNYNYGPAGAYLGFDGLAHPEIVATDPLVSFKTAVWFWVVHSNCHSAITSGKGFGATIKAINAKECDGGNPEAVNNRVKYYKSYCDALDVDPGSNLQC